MENSCPDPSEFKAFGLSYSSTLPLYLIMQNIKQAIKRGLLPDL